MFYAKNASLLASLVVISSVIFVVFIKFYSINSIVHISNYTTDIKILQQLETVEPPFELLNQGQIELHKDNVGIFPMYFFLYNIKCDEIKMTVEIYEVHKDYNKPYY